MQPLFLIFSLFCLKQHYIEIGILVDSAPPQCNATVFKYKSRVCKILTEMHLWLIDLSQPACNLTTNVKAEHSFHVSHFLIITAEVECKTFNENSYTTFYFFFTFEYIFLPILVLFFSGLHTGLLVVMIYLHILGKGCEYLQQRPPHWEGESPGLKLITHNFFTGSHVCIWLMYSLGDYYGSFSYI